MSDKDKGFASMDEAKQKEIASQGGKAGTKHEHNSDHDNEHTKNHNKD